MAFKCPITLFPLPVDDEVEVTKCPERQDPGREELEVAVEGHEAAVLVQLRGPDPKAAVAARGGDDGTPVGVGEGVADSLEVHETGDVGQDGDQTYD